MTGPTSPTGTDRADSASAAAVAAEALTAAETRAAAMPKAELHLHLDGSVLPATALELAESRGIAAPTTLEAMRAALVAPPHGASQAALLRAFDLPIALMQDAEALSRVAFELVVAKAAERVRYVEIRWGPLLHTRRGLSLADGISAVVSGAADAAARTGTVVRLIATALRSHPPADNEVLARVAAGFQDRGLTAFDLAGPEEAFPDPLLHRRAFDVARSEGLAITIHAGEWGGAAQVRRALEVHPRRIAHGPGAVDDPSFCEELITRDVCLDLAPTSNVQAGIYPSRATHPLAVLHRRGVPVSLSTDDRTVSDITLTDEFTFAQTEIGLTPAELWTINRRALDVAFADDATLRPLRAEFDAWAARTPEVGGAG